MTSNPAAQVRWRRAEPTDVAALAELERQLFPMDAWTPTIFSQELALVPETRDYWVGVVLATEVDASEDQLIGYGGLSILGPDSEIMTFAIAPELQRRGLGADLLERLLNAARARNCTHTFLEVRADNAPALQLYRSAGFVAGERRPRYYSDGVDAILMAKALREPSANGPTNFAGGEQ